MKHYSRYKERDPFKINCHCQGFPTLLAVPLGSLVAEETTVFWTVSDAGFFFLCVCVKHLIKNRGNFCPACLRAWTEGMVLVRCDLLAVKSAVSSKVFQNSGLIS